MALLLSAFGPDTDIDPIFLESFHNPVLHQGNSTLYLKYIINDKTTIIFGCGKSF